jgi:hypothetical protein
MSTLSRSPLSSSSSVSPLKRKAMSVTQTYYLAHTARGKLSSEAARADHNLRLLVGHANLLDSLMLELAEAEQEQESWFNQSVKKATKNTEEPKHIQWADAIVEDPEEEDWQAEDADSSDSESEYDSDDDMEMEVISRVQSHPVMSTHAEVEEEYEDDGEEDFEGLQLHLTQSHSANPPELDNDSDSSEDDSMPPSPPSTALPTFSEKQQIATTSYYSKSNASIPPSEQQAFFDEGFYLPQRANPGLISAISVY